MTAEEIREQLNNLNCEIEVAEFDLAEMWKEYNLKINSFMNQLAELRAKIKELLPDNTKVEKPI